MVVTAVEDATVAAGTADIAVKISEPLHATGAFTNVSALPAASATVKMFPSHRKNFFYPRQGFTAASLPIGDIYGADNSDVGASKQTGAGFKAKVIIQGSAQKGINLFRMSSLFVARAFARHIVVVPSKI